MSDAPFLFDDLSDSVNFDDDDPDTPETDPDPDRWASETERIVCSIMGELDCIISDDVPDKRYDAAQKRVEKIVRRELTHESEDD